MTQELEITTMSAKGQIVIPQFFRNEMDLKPKTRFVVARIGDTIVMKVLHTPNMEKELLNLFKKMDKKKINLSDKEIIDEIKTYRRIKREK